MKRILFSLFYILSLGLSFDALAATLSDQHEVDYLFEASNNLCLYDSGVSLDEDDTTPTAAILKLPQAVISRPVSHTLDSFFLAASYWPESRAPPAQLIS